jgi:hypothetical protein
MSMKLVNVQISTEEEYPVYYVNLQEEAADGQCIQMTQKMYNRFCAIQRDYDKMQDELEELLKELRDRHRYRLTQQAIEGAKAAIDPRPTDPALRDYLSDPGKYEVLFALPKPGVPDKNGNVFTEEAIQQMYNQIIHVPIANIKHGLSEAEDNERRIERMSMYTIENISNCPKRICDLGTS